MVYCTVCGDRPDCPWADQAAALTAAATALAIEARTEGT